MNSQFFRIVDVVHRHYPVRNWYMVRSIKFCIIHDNKHNARHFLYGKVLNICEIYFLEH